MRVSDSDKEPSLADAGLYLFMDDFTLDSCRDAVEFILLQNLKTGKKRREFLTLVISSPGGDLTSCFALVDTMKSSVIPIRTVAIGQIASCGIVTFMAGEKGHRLATPNTSVLSHQYSWQTSGKQHELFAAVRECDLTEKRMMAHYRKCTDLSDEDIRAYLLPPHDVWLDAEEALKLGIADEIVTTY